jgi:hypothetical protein
LSGYRTPSPSRHSFWNIPKLALGCFGIAKASPSFCHGSNKYFTASYCGTVELQRIVEALFETDQFFSS